MKVGIIGTGRITERFVPEAREIGGIEVSAIYNPHLESAKRFSFKHKIDFFTDDLDIFADKLEAVYIASPHETHYSYAKKMLERGKHVLCEKPLCLEKRQATELFQLAEERKLVLMEAIKTACCPGFLELLRVAQRGDIGEIKDIEAGFTRLTPKDTREFTNTGYGGSFTEFGSYVLLPIFKLMGLEYRDIRFQSLCDEHGVDWYTKGFLTYDDRMATTKTGLSVKSEGQLLISGTKGYILAQSPWWLTRKFEVRYEEPTRRAVYECPFRGQGLRYEIEIFLNEISGKVKGISRVTLEESIAMAGIMEKFLYDRKYALGN